MQHARPQRQQGILMRPTVQLVGQVEHSDFADALRLLREQANVVDAAAITSPELVVIAQCRPGAIANNVIEQLRRRAPLAGIVALLGSWCEGESRTGRPWPGVPRLYWYEFPAWWRRQSTLRAAGLCPDWARPFDFGFRISDFGFESEGIRNATRGVVVLSVPVRDTRLAIADVLADAGYATVWHRIGWPDCEVHGAAAGIWDGGQLDDREADDLALFCRKLSRDGAPVIALLDFPRRDRVRRAIDLGALAVLGKPWRNEALVATLEAVAMNTQMVRAA